MKRFLIFFIIIVAIFSGCNEKEQKEEQAKPQKSQAQKQIQKKQTIQEYRFIDKNRFSIEAQIGKNSIALAPSKKINILFFFTTWCPSCKAQISQLNEIAKKYPKDVQIIGILLDRPKHLQEFLQKEHTNFFVSINYGENITFADRIYQFVHAPASKPIPMTLILKDNKYFIHYIGAAPYEIVETDIKKALGE